MRSTTAGSSALTVRVAREGSALLLPTHISSTSNSPPSSTIRLKALRRMSESMRCPSMVTVSSTTRCLRAELSILHWEGAGKFADGRKRRKETIKKEGETRTTDKREEGLSMPPECLD